MSQERIQKAKSKTPAQETSVDVSNSDVTNAELSEQTDEVLGSIDDVLEAQLDEELLADIDDVLEQDAEQFVSQYIQAGGE